MTNTEARPAKCLRCGHAIRSAKSVAAKYGPVCRAKIRLAAITEAVKGFAQAQVDKARELIADGGLIPTSRPGVFRAVSSKGDDTYLTSAKGNCNCPHGLRVTTARFCYHVAGARILVATGRAA
jgi:hypothetical protein